MNTSESRPQDLAELAPSSFRSQYTQCAKENMIGFAQGPEEEMVPAFPNDTWRAYVLKNGKPPAFRTSTCKKFGGLCSSKNVECIKIRSLPNVEVQRRAKLVR